MAKIRTTAALVGLVCAALVDAGGAARAQSLTVLPVTVLMGAGQLATTLTVINQGEAETAVQVRAYVWGQDGGGDQLSPSDDVVASPPLATIPPGGTQVVRLILRRPPQGREATYRVLLDQIPPPAAPGTVRIALRMSIPIFAQPGTRAVPNLQFRVERDAGQTSLVALNDGGRHETVRDVVLMAADGRKVGTVNGATPYVLAGATRRWPIVTPAGLPAPGGTVRLVARMEGGAVDQPVRIVGVR